MDRVKNLAIDLFVLVVYLIAANPAITGIGVHEWLGLGVMVAFLVHCIVHVDWVGKAIIGFKNSTGGARGNLILDASILLAFMIVTVSGLLISGTVLQSIGLYAEGYFFWGPLHAVAAKVLLALLLVHVVVHWKWFALFIKKGKGDNHAEAERDND